MLLCLDPKIVRAPRLQFGLLNESTSLNCSVNYNATVNVRWINNTVEISGSFRVGLHHEGQYLCEAYLSDIDLSLNNTVQFTVIGETYSLAMRLQLSYRAFGVQV